MGTWARGPSLGKWGRASPERTFLTPVAPAATSNYPGNSRPLPGALALQSQDPQRWEPPAQREVRLRPTDPALLLSETGILGAGRPCQGTVARRLQPVRTLSFHAGLPGHLGGRAGRGQPARKEAWICSDLRTQTRQLGACPLAHTHLGSAAPPAPVGGQWTPPY